MFGVIVAFILGVIVGLLIAWYPLRQQTRAQEAQIEGLRVALDEKERSLQAHAAKVEGLQSQVSQGEETIRDLKAQLDWRKLTIGQLKEEVSAREGRREELKARAPVTKPDKLERIEGIGPKISKLLQEAGIATFEQLAATEVSRLEQILQDADLRLADPATWPEQARLAAAGDWKALDALQEDLKGGRRA